MRFATLFLLLALPGTAMADSYTLHARISDVTVYPSGNKITREAAFSVPAGQHLLVLPDLPTSINPETIRVQIDGAKMGPLTIRERYVPPRDDTKSPEVFAAENLVETIEQHIQDIEDRAAQARLFAQAATAQMAFLGQIGTSDEIGAAGIDTLRGISQMISEEALAANQSIHAAGIEARLIERELKTLHEDLEDAEQALHALVPEEENRAFLSVVVEAQDTTDGQLTLTYYSQDALWAPVYDMYLTRGTNASLSIERGAFVRQDTGETWHDVNLTLSTIFPFAQVEPGTLYPRKRSIAEPEPPRAEFRADGARLSAGAIVSPAIVAEQASMTHYDGYAIVYTYPTPVTIATNADQVRLKLDTLILGADISAKAVPARDETGFLVANIANESGEVILPSHNVSLFVDGVFAGTSENFPGIPAGDTAELPFGPIEGLRLERVVVNQNEGDRGIISRSNEQTRSVQVKISNLTNDTWPVRLLDQVPYSEQEDLQITWEAEPPVTDENVDNQRGILGWDLTLSPGETRMIRLEQTLSWPEGMLLR